MEGETNHELILKVVRASKNCIRNSLVGIVSWEGHVSGSVADYLWGRWGQSR